MAVTRHKQRGAAAIFAAIGMIAMLSATALAIDLGHLYFAKRDLQRLANLAALDAMTAAGGCQDPQLFGSLAERQQFAYEQVRQSLQRNAGPTAYLQDGGSVTLGRETRRAGIRRFSPESTAANVNAVRVVLQRPLPRRIMGGFGADSSRPLVATAAATQAANVSMSIGSVPLGLNLSELPIVNSVLGGLLGQSPNLSLASYQGLASAEVPFDDLIAAQSTNVPVDEFLNQPTTAPAFLEQLARALFQTADDAAAAVQAIASSSEAMNEFVPGDVITVPQGTGENVGETAVPVFELVRATAQAAGGGVFDLAPDVSVPGVVHVQGTITLFEPARLVVGPAVIDEFNDYVTKAQNSAGRINLAAELLPLPILGNPPVNLRLQLDVGHSEAALTRLFCASRDRDQHLVEIVASAGVVRLQLLNDQPLVNVSAPFAGQTVGIKVWATGSVNVADARTEALRFSGPFDSADEQILASNVQSLTTSTSGGLANAVADLSGNLDLQVELDMAGVLPALTGAVDPLVNGFVAGQLLPALNAVLQPVLLNLADQILNPVANTLGLKIPGADVLVADVQVPRPNLIDTGP